MASKGYTISVATDSRLFEQGVRMGIIKPVEDADDALTDLGKNKGPDQLTDEIKEAQRATDRLGDDVRQSAKQMQSDYRKTGQVARDAAEEGGDGWAKSTRKSSEQAGESVKEFGNEAKQNISETFSSFRGDVTDFGQIAQDTLGGLASGLDGIPAIAAVAAGAAGIGLILGALQNGQANSEEFKQSVSALTGELIDAGNDGSRSIDQIVDALKTLATDGDEAGNTLDKLATLGKRTGDTLEDIASAYTGNSSVLREHIRANTEYAKALERQLITINANDDAERKTAGPLTDKITALQQLNDVYSQAATKAEAAEKQAQQFAESGAEQLQAKKAAVESIGQAYQDAAGDAQTYVDKETQAFDTDAYVKNFEKRAQELADYATNLQKAAVTLSPEALAFLESQGTDAASTLVSAYVNGTAANRARLQKVWSQAGSASSASYMNEFKGGIPSSVAGPDIVARWTVDRTALDAAIRSQVNVNIPVTITDYKTGRTLW